MRGEVLMRSVVIRLRTIAALSLLLGCAEMPPRPGPGGDGSPSADAPDALVDRDVPAPLDAPDADVAPPDVLPDADVTPPDVLPDADVPPPDAPLATGPRLTGTFVSSGTSTGRLSGGFVWHGGSTRLSGWLH
jgi:hypothetical protein